MHLVETYALACGARIDTPYIRENGNLDKTTDEISEENIDDKNQFLKIVKFYPIHWH